MGTLVLSNSTGESIRLRDFYVDLADGASLTRENIAWADYQRMGQLHELVADGNFTATFTPSDDEIAAGALTPPKAIEPGDLALVGGSDINAVMGTFTKTFAAGAGGSADDVTVYAVNTLPFKVQILGGFLHVGTNVSGASVTARSAAAGGGTAAGVASAATATCAPFYLASGPVTLTPGALVGLFLRRSDSGVGGTAVLFYRRVS